eukprot:2348174-Prymnesium_polylepis.1
MRQDGVCELWSHGKKQRAAVQIAVQVRKASRLREDVIADKLGRRDECEMREAAVGHLFPRHLPPPIHCPQWLNRHGRQPRVRSQVERPWIVVVHLLEAHGVDCDDVVREVEVEEAPFSEELNKGVGPVNSIGAVWFIVIRANPQIWLHATKRREWRRSKRRRAATMSV